MRTLMQAQLLKLKQELIHSSFLFSDIETGGVHLPLQL